METYHESPPLGTCRIEFSVENKYTMACTYLDTGPTMNQEVGGRGQTKGKTDKTGQSKTMKAKLHSKDTSIHARDNHPLANWHKQISQLNLIIDYLITRNFP